MRNSHPTLLANKADGRRFRLKISESFLFISYHLCGSRRVEADNWVKNPVLETGIQKEMIEIGKAFDRLINSGNSRHAGKKKIAEKFGPLFPSC